MASSWSWVTWMNVQADLGLDPLELDLHRPAQLEVEGAERLVEQQHLGAVDQRPGQRHALLLPAGELRRLLARLAAELDQVEHLAGPAVSTSLRLAPAQPEGDVLEDVEVREQRVALEDGVDRPPVGLGVGDVLSPQRDRARTWASRARRPSAASWSCRSPEGPSSAKNEPRRDVEVQRLHRVNAANSLVRLAQLQAFGRGSRRLLGGLRLSHL